MATEPVTLPVYDIEGKEVGTSKLNAAVFDGVINEAVVYQAVNAYRANQRKGLASTKTRGEVSGGGKKPWKQKGTGRARVGSIRSPLWRHGGVVFGPHPRDFSYKLPEKIKNLALKSTLNAKVKENNFIILDNAKIGSSKTKEAVKILSGLNLAPKKNKKKCKVLFLIDKMDKALLTATRNIEFLSLNLATNTHAYEVLENKKLLITKDGLAELTNRLK